MLTLRLSGCAPKGATTPRRRDACSLHPTFPLVLVRPRAYPAAQAKMALLLITLCQLLRDLVAAGGRRPAPAGIRYPSSVCAPPGLAVPARTAHDETHADQRHAA